MSTRRQQEQQRVADYITQVEIQAETIKVLVEALEMAREHIGGNIPSGKAAIIQDALKRAGKGNA